MTDVQQVLREALDEQAAAAPRARGDLFEQAQARQRARRHRVAGVLGAAAVIGGLVGGVVGGGPGRADGGPGPWTAVQTAIQYDWTIHTLLPCLRALGHPVTVPPPDRAEFLATWEDEPYRPLAHVPGLTDAEYALLVAQCPQSPPDAQLWG